MGGTRNMYGDQRLRGNFIFIYPKIQTREKKGGGGSKSRWDCGPLRGAVLRVLDDQNRLWLVAVHTSLNRRGGQGWYKD